MVKRRHTWTSEEDDLLRTAHATHGNKWKKIWETNKDSFSRHVSEDSKDKGGPLKDRWRVLSAVTPSSTTDKSIVPLQDSIFDNLLEKSSKEWFHWEDEALKTCYS